MQPSSVSASGGQTEDRLQVPARVARQGLLFTGNNAYPCKYRLGTALACSVGMPVKPPKKLMKFVGETILSSALLAITNEIVSRIFDKYLPRPEDDESPPEPSTPQAPTIDLN